MRFERLIAATFLTVLSLPVLADDFIFGGAPSACDPTVSSCLPESEKPVCDVTACFTTAEGQRQYEIKHGCVFPPPSPCSDSIIEITIDVLRQIFNSGAIPEARIAAIANELNAALQNAATSVLINTKRKIAHFLAQIKQEVGPNMRLTENLNYSVGALKSTFSYFHAHPAEADLYGRKPGQAANQEAIANRVYANRIGNGDVASGDGWRYRGRGMIQLTGKANYETFNIKHNEIWHDDKHDFLANPDLVADEKYAVRSALVFWKTNNLEAIAAQGITCEETDNITRVVNRNTSSYAQRCSNLTEIMSIPFFEEC